MLQLFNFLNPFVEAFFFSFFVEVALPLVPDLEYFRFLLIVVAFGRFFYSLGRYPMDSIAAIICEHVTVEGKEQYCLGSPCSPENKYTEYTTPSCALTEKYFCCGTSEILFSKISVLARCRTVGLGIYVFGIPFGALTALI